MSWNRNNTLCVSKQWNMNFLPLTPSTPPHLIKKRWKYYSLLSLKILGVCLPLLIPSKFHPTNRMGILKEFILLKRCISPYYLICFTVPICYCFTNFPGIWASPVLRRDGHYSKIIFFFRKKKGERDVFWLQEGTKLCLKSRLFWDQNLVSASYSIFQCH